MSIGVHEPLTLAQRSLRYDEWMSLALDQARQAVSTDDVPVGAVVVDAAGRLAGVGRNRREADADPTAHAEVLALRSAAARVGAWRLEGCTLVVTLEPCVMCAGALVAARIDRVVLGAWDAKAGAAGSVWDLLRDNRANHQVEVIAGVRADECALLLSRFFESHRDRR